MSGVFGGHAGFCVALLANQLKALLAAEDECRGGEDSGQHATGRDHADGLATVADGKPGSRIEDMAVAFSIDCEGAEIIAGGGNGLVWPSLGGPAIGGGDSV